MRMTGAGLGAAVAAALLLGGAASARGEAAGPLPAPCATLRGALAALYRAEPEREMRWNEAADSIHSWPSLREAVIGLQQTAAGMRPRRLRSMAALLTLLRGQPDDLGPAMGFAEAHDIPFFLDRDAIVCDDLRSWECVWRFNNLIRQEPIDREIAENQGGIEVFDLQAEPGVLAFGHQEGRNGWAFRVLTPSLGQDGRMTLDPEKAPRIWTSAFYDETRQDVVRLDIEPYVAVMRRELPSFRRDENLNDDLYSLKKLPPLPPQTLLLHLRLHRLAPDLPFACEFALPYHYDFPRERIALTATERLGGRDYAPAAAFQAYLSEVAPIYWSSLGEAESLEARIMPLAARLPRQDIPDWLRDLAEDIYHREDRPEVDGFYEMWGEDAFPIVGAIFSIPPGHRPPIPWSIVYFPGDLEIGSSSSPW